MVVSRTHIRSLIAAAMSVAVLAAVACSSTEMGPTFGTRASLVCCLDIKANERSGAVLSFGGAMSPTIHNEQIVGFEAVEPGSISRADVILFAHDSARRGDDGCRAGFIKRVVGLPGDEIDVRGGSMSVNGVELGKEHPASAVQIDNRRFFEYPVVVPIDMYFVIGDSPRSSNDSRNWGYVDDADIVGRLTTVDGDPIK